MTGPHEGRLDIRGLGVQLQQPGGIVGPGVGVYHLDLVHGRHGNRRTAEDQSHYGHIEHEPEVLGLPGYQEEADGDVRLRVKPQVAYGYRSVNMMDIQNITLAFVMSLPPINGMMARVKEARNAIAVYLRWCLEES